MAMVDISAIHRKLLGISYLSEEENRSLRSAWDARFEERDAFFIRANLQDSIADIQTNLFREIRSQGYTALGGTRFVVAVFYDAAAGTLPAADLNAINFGLIGASLSAMMRFAYLGRQPYADPEAARRFVSAVTASSQSSLCLVATHPLAENSLGSWRAVCLWLDVLRRNEEVGQVIPNTRYNIGFLRYAEFDEERITALRQKIIEYEKKLGDEGADMFDTLLTEFMQKLESGIDTKYFMNAGCQPVHPGLFNQRKGLFRKLDPEPANRTSSALKLTGQRLMQRIYSENDLTVQQAKECLTELFETAGAGIELILNADEINSVISRRSTNRLWQETLAVPFIGETEEPTQLNEKIAAYFKDCKENARSRVACSVTDTLKEAYKELIPVYEAKKAEMERTLNKMRVELSNMPDKGEFVEMVQGFGDRMECCFSRGQGAAANDMSLGKIVVCREEEDRAYYERAYPTSSAGYYISENIGGIRTLDDAEIKAVQTAFYLCSEEILRQLIW